MQHLEKEEILRDIDLDSYGCKGTYVAIEMKNFTE